MGTAQWDAVHDLKTIETQRGAVLRIVSNFKPASQFEE
jgi:hypothetical protein